MKEYTHLIESHLSRVDGPNDKELVFKNFQEIPDWFIQNLRDYKDAQKFERPEMRRIASIPEAVVHAWEKQGFKLAEHTAEEIHARLRHENLEAFITGTP